MGLLGHVEESLGELVLDAAVRQPDEDACIPAQEVSRRKVVTEVAGRVGAAPERSRTHLRGRLRAPLMVAAARLRGHPGRAFLVALGVAASAATLTAVLGGSLVARDRAVQRALAALSPSERSFRVDAFGLPGDADYTKADRQVRTALGTLAPGVPLRGTFFRELRINGELVQLVGLDGLGKLVRLRSGRLPRACSPSRCEVLEIGSGRLGRLDEAGIHLVRVGVGGVPRRALFGSSFDTEQQGGDNPTLLIASGARAFDPLPAFDGLYRIYSWISPLDPRRLHVWEIGSVLARETVAQTELARHGDVYQLSGPDQALVEARSEGRVSAQRMLLVGGEGAALLLGFALVAAMGLRRGLANEGRRLLQRGARRSQVWLSAIAEITATTLAGALVGAAGGVAVVAAIAGAAGLPRGAVLAHSVATGVGMAVVVAAWLAATLAVLAGARARGVETRVRRLRLLDVAALGAASAVGLGLARGGLDAETLSSGGGRALLLALPILVSFVRRGCRRSSPAAGSPGSGNGSRAKARPLRLALLALSRAPCEQRQRRPFCSSALVLGSSRRAGVRRSTEGARDEAAFTVPLDFSLSEGPRLVLPLAAASLPRYEALAPGVGRFPVLRRTRRCRRPGHERAQPDSA